MKRVLHLLFALCALQVVTTTGCNCGRYDDEFNRVCDSLCEFDAGRDAGGTAGGSSAGGVTAGGASAGGSVGGGEAGGAAGGVVIAGGLATGGGSVAGGDAGGTPSGGGANAGGGVVVGGGSVAGGDAGGTPSGGGANAGGGVVVGGGAAVGGGIPVAGGFVAGGGIPIGGGFVVGGGTPIGGGFVIGGGIPVGGGLPVGGGFVAGGGSATDGGFACAMETEPCDVRPCCGTGVRCIPSTMGSFCRSTAVDAGLCAGQGASCLTAIPCCDGLTCNTTTTCQPTRDGGLCLVEGSSCSTSSACCNGCCNSAGVCSTIGGACVISAPFQCQNAGSFCNAEVPSRRCCMPPLVPALQCLQPAGQACATGADCCSGCCQGRPGIGLCTPGSLVPDGYCQ